jgi:hypothetical protein
MGTTERFQWSHDFSAMETAAIFRPSKISKKRRFWRIMLTSNNTFRKLTVTKGHFRYAQTFRASPGKMYTTSMRGKWDVLRPIKSIRLARTALNPQGHARQILCIRVMASLLSKLSLEIWFSRTLNFEVFPTACSTGIPRAKRRAR